MIVTLIEQAIRHRWLVVILAVVIVSCGVYAFQRLPIDAYLDISGQVVAVVTVYPGRAPEDVER